MAGAHDPESVSNGWNLDRREFLEDRLGADPKRATAVFEADLTWLGGPGVEARTEGAGIAFDLPPWAGGAGRGVQPVEALLAALAAEVVAGFTLAAARAGMTLSAVSAHVEGGVDLARSVGTVDQRPIVDLVQLELVCATAGDPTLAEGWLHQAVARSAIAGLFAAAGDPVQARLTAPYGRA
ncbi:MAG TPA: hypothetical protein VHL09_13280 [Dehalococcoidia bacterium]|nr:hypothetical protein [Dehalococcoidia bacterium]